MSDIVNMRQKALFFVTVQLETGGLAGSPSVRLKGETLRIKAGYQQELIINRGVYIVPVGHDGAWRVGATYNLNDNSPVATAEARGELIEKMGELVDFPFDIADQEWGFRPVTDDRRPIIGRHPELRCCYILRNGYKRRKSYPFLLR